MTEADLTESDLTNTSTETQAAKPRGHGGAVFTEGSIMRHVVVMTLMAAIGLIAIFFVDAISLFYISQLGDNAQTAAVGRASYLIAFMISIAVGIMIGTSVIVARAVGGNRRESAERSAGSALIGAFVLGWVFVALMYGLKGWLFSLLDAEGAALAYADQYLSIILPGMPFMMVGMTAMGVLRSVGDAKRAMYITVIGGIATAILDPLFIFVLDLQIVGAAIVSLAVRFFFGFLGLYFLMRFHRMPRIGSAAEIGADLKEIAAFAVPATFTNLASPVGAFLIAEKIASYGDAAIAGQAIVDRLIPLAFGVIFALSGAVGPIIGQNVGAGRMDRVQQALIDGLKFNAIYVLGVWALVFVGQDAIIAAYAADGDMALMIRLFALYIAGSFFFNGMLFVTNAAFNNLGQPLLATLFNWSRQTIGVLPFIYFGALWGGLTGIAIGVFVGSIPFAILALITALTLIRRRTREMTA